VQVQRSSIPCTPPSHPQVRRLQSQSPGSVQAAASTGSGPKPGRDGSVRNGPGYDQRCWVFDPDQEASGQNRGRRFLQAEGDAQASPETPAQTGSGCGATELGDRK